MLGGGQLGRYAIVAARIAGYGTVVLDPDLPPPPERSPTSTSSPPTTTPPPSTSWPPAARSSPRSSRTRRRSALQRLAADVSVAPPARGRGDRPGPPRREGVPRRRRLPRRAVGAARRRRPTSPRRVAARAARDRQDRPPRLRRQGPAAPSSDAAESSRHGAQLDRVPCIVERRVPLDTEVSVVLARRADGASAAYPVAENVHRDGILDLTVVPARVDAALAAEAERRWRARIADALDYVGVLAVELFVSAGRLLVNELAPRPHNSGHWTLDAAGTSQFAQQIRAVTGAALGATDMTAPAVAMVNLLGDLWFGAAGARRVEPSWAAVLADPTRPAPPVREVDAAARAQDGPPHGARRRRRRGRRPGVAPARTVSVRNRRSRGVARSATMAPMQRPPERIDVADAGVVLRRHRPGDVDALHAVDRGEPRPPAPVHAVGRPGPDATAAFVAKRGRGLGVRRELRLLVTEPAQPATASACWAAAGCTAAATRGDRDRLLAAPRRRSAEG